MPVLRRPANLDSVPLNRSFSEAVAAGQHRVPAAEWNGLGGAAMEHSLDVLAFGTHPDDLELCCGGTLLLLANRGYRVGAVDLTRGELGTRGSEEIRPQETAGSRPNL